MSIRTADIAIEYKTRTLKAHGLVCDEGLSELRDLAEQNQRKPGWSSITDAMRDKLASGDLSNVSKSDKLLDLLETPDLTSYVRATSERVMAGGVADVPAYLAGSPVAMRRRVRQPERMPITLVCDVGTSGGISGEIIQRRGVAVLALVRKLETEGYPVDLWLGFTAQVSGHGLPTSAAVKVDTKPLDLARACWALSNEDYQRKVMFQTIAGVSGRERSDFIVWAWKDIDWIETPALQRACYAALLNQDEANLLVMPSVYVTEREHFTSDAKTLAWVNAMYKRACELVTGPQE
tara:strand:- start:2704 stop:3582 length:879 start_codon:yes stop_codon:yes gene_type:complete